MKPRRSNQRNQALTLVEVLVVITALAVLVAMLLPAFFAAMRKAQKSNCYNNLRQIGLSFLVWGNDYNGKFPMQVSVTNGGTMELAAVGNVVATFQIMSNELSTPKILLCPKDHERFLATNLSALKKSNVSYFVGLVAGTNYPEAFLSGDDNFSVAGTSVKSGLLDLLTNTSVAWTAARHKFAGNIGFADGSVQQSYNQIETNSMRFFLHQTGLTTNRLVIP